VLTTSRGREGLLLLLLEESAGALGESR
jgi:hypothetical protein